MHPATILVTGAGGFVGSHLLPALRAAFPDARIIGTGLSHPGRRLDITDGQSVKEALAALAPDMCIHLAAIAAIGAVRADPAKAWAINCQGALNIGRAICAVAPSCRMIFISSAEVYGASFKPGMALDETAPLEPMNEYAATKAAAEMGLCALAAGGLKVLRLRPFNHTGPGQREEFVVPSFSGQIARIAAGLAPPEMAVGALDPERDFLDIRDVCAAYIAAVQRFDTLPNNLALNIASGGAVRIGEVLDNLLARVAMKIVVRQDPARLRPTEIYRAVGSAEAAFRYLGWRHVHGLDETLEGVFANARQVAERQTA